MKGKGSSKRRKKISQGVSKKDSSSCKLDTRIRGNKWQRRLFPLIGEEQMSEFKDVLKGLSVGVIEANFREMFITFIVRTSRSRKIPFVETMNYLNANPFKEEYLNALRDELVRSVKE